MPLAYCLRSSLAFCLRFSRHAGQTSASGVLPTFQPFSENSLTRTLGGKLAPVRWMVSLSLLHSEQVSCQPARVPWLVAILTLP